MHRQTRGLVIRSVDYKDADKILTVLTDDMGKITVSAGRARKNSGVMSTSCSLFAYSDMVLFENRGRYSLSEADTIEIFSGISSDLDKLALASYLAELLGTEPEGNGINPDILRLALNSLFAISEGKRRREVVKSAFELRYAALCGYAPPILENPGLLQDSAARAAAQYILSCDMKKLFSFSLDAPSDDILFNFCENYLLSCLERNFKTLDFYKSLAEISPKAL